MTTTIELDTLVDQLDLATKVRLLTGETSFTLYGQAQIGLAPIALSDGPTGVRGLEFSGGPATCLFPNATLLASTWSTAALSEVGRLLAEEAVRQRIHVVLGPTINLHRSPLGGRLFEAYSEDPFLTGALAAAYVEGLQSGRVGACLKHFVANESETDRTTVDSQMDERTLREVYLLPFEIAVTDSDPWTVMAAYNDINGIAATEHDELNNEILKREWQWLGLIVSDWSATKSAAAAANGGLDLVMPGPEGPWGAALVDAVNADDVAEATIDDHVRRLLRLGERVGALGEPRSWPGVPTPDSPKRRDQLTRLAVAGMTVLENGGALPLPVGRRVAVIGRHAVDTVCLGGGSSQVRAPYQVTIADGLRQRLGESVTVVDGVGVRSRLRPARPGSLVDPITGRPGVRVRIFDRDGTTVADRIAEDNQCDLHGVDFPGAEARIELRALVPAGRQSVGALGLGDWEIRVGDRTITTTLLPLTSDHAEGILRPPGTSTDLVLDEPTELVATVSVRLGEHNSFAVVAEPTPMSDDDAIRAAVEAAQLADVAVVVVGLTQEQETEGLDKHTLALPGRQDELVEAVARVAERTVVVVNAATPILMPWRGSVDAILVAGLPGQEAGHAVAAALVNDLEPSGRLVTTFPAADEATPAWDVTPTSGALRYQEGPFIGYRGHAAGLAAAPAYWFGHGSGYGDFVYGHPEIVGRSVTVPVENRAAFDSREVVQVYFDPAAEGQPVRLVGWGSGVVPAGGTARIQVDCDSRMWRTWDPESGAWTLLTGGELLVARGLGDIRYRLPSS